jgi:hypothetical protein
LHKRIEVREINGYEAWDEFVDRAYNGTIFHKQRFLAYHPTGRFTHRFLGFYENGTHLVAVLPCSITAGVLTSPAGASFGGVALPPTSVLDIHHVIECLLEWAKAAGVHTIDFTHAPLIYNDRLSQDLDFVLCYHGFVNSRNLFASAVDLGWFDKQDPLVSLSAQGRRAVKKTFGIGLTVETNSQDLAAYYQMLVENKAKFDVKPAHSLDELIRLRELFPDAFRLFLVRHQGEPLAGIYTFHCNPRVLLCFYIASRPEHQQLRPVNRALFEVAVWAQQCNYSYLDLGVSMNTASDNPMEPAWSLISFKEHTGSKGYLRPSYRWTAP